MVEKSSINPSIQGVTGYFFKEEYPGGLEHALNLGYTHLPVHDMMQHSEIEHGVEVFIGKRKILNTSHRKNNATVGLARKSLLRAANLQRVKVEAIEIGRAHV